MVQDTGIGIKKEDQDKLFRLFGMIDLNFDGINQTGCGMGLTVSKKYIEQLNGKISLESIEGSGTIVTFSVDCTDPESSLSQEDSEDPLETRDFREYVNKSKLSNQKIFKEFS
jgi:signal transduction histidine kinase